MRKPAIGPFRTIKRFALEELDDGRGLKRVLLTVEAIDAKGDVKQIEATMTPKEALHNGNALSLIGRTLNSVHH